MKQTKFLAMLFMAFAVAFSACTNVDDPDDPKDEDKELTVLYGENFGVNLTTTAPTTGWPAAASYTEYLKGGKGGAAVVYAAEGGAVTIRGNQPSSGYTAASGSGNAMMAATGASLVIKNIATCGATNLKLSFGSVVAASTINLSYRISGQTEWVAVPYVKETTAWGLVENVEIKLPTGTNTINLKFTAGVTEFGSRIDDIKITTEDKTGDPVIDQDNTGGTGGTDNDGTKAKPFSIADVISINPQSTTVADKTGVWIKGYIVGYYNSTPNPAIVEATAPFTEDFNIMVAATAGETVKTKMVSIQLPAGAVRTALGLKTTPANIGKEVLLFGDIMKYNNFPGLKNTTAYWYVDSNTGIDPTNPVDPTGAIFSETILTQASFDKFTTFSVTGTQVWKFDSRYGAVMTGFENSVSYENEDWFITPAINLTGKNNVKVSFEHARGPAGSITVGVAEGYYTVWVSTDYNTGNPTAATWTQLNNVVHGTAAWAYVSSGELTIPADKLSANTKIGFKYLSISGKSATWEIKNLVVK